MQSNRFPRRILLVEDDSADADLARCALAETGISTTVDRVADGVGCMNHLNEALAGAHPLPRLIFLDLNMPRMDGREVLRRIRATHHFNRVPIVVLTTSTALKDIDVSYDLGANSFISKPLDFDAFVGKMRAVLTYWFEIASLPDPI